MSLSSSAMRSTREQATLKTTLTPVPILHREPIGPLAGAWLTCPRSRYQGLRECEYLPPKDWGVRSFLATRGSKTGQVPICV